MSCPSLDSRCSLFEFVVKEDLRSSCPHLKVRVEGRPNVLSPLAGAFPTRGFAGLGHKINTGPWTLLNYFNSLSTLVIVSTVQLCKPRYLS
jgi:hypothetical protein